MWKKSLLIVMAFLLGAGPAMMLQPGNAAVLAEGAETDVYVSPDGSDATGDGTIENPYRTLEKARDMARTRLPDMDSNITVYLRGGNYYLSRAVTFTEEDSGKNGHLVVYRNYPNETPVIHGGEPVTEWTAVPGKPYYTANVEAGRTFHNLEDNGVRAIKARFPNSGYLQSEAMAGGQEKRKLQYRAGDLPAFDQARGLQIYTWPGIDTGHQAWSTSTRTVTDVDRENRILSWDRETQYNMSAGSRYYLQGLLDFLDEPGEFYLDDLAGKLIYYPFGDDIATRQIVAPRTKNIFEFIGSSSAQPVSGIRLEGLTIRNSDTTEEIGEYEDDRYGAVYLRNAERIEIKDCRIRNTGANGVAADGWVQHSVIAGNEIADIGYNGVYLWNEMFTSKDINKNNVVTNNHIYNVGVLGGHAGGIRLNNSGGNELSYNTIHDSKRYAISLKSLRPGNLIGQTIDGIMVTSDNVRDFTHTQNNIVKYNDLSNVNTDSEDTGLIESWGSDYGNRIENNRLHHSNLINDYRGNGIYLDDESDYFIVRNNLIDHLNLTGSGILNDLIEFKGNHNKAVNNILADNRLDSTGDVFSMGPEGESYHEYERNVVYRNGSTNLFGPFKWTAHTVAASDRNLYYHPLGLYTMKPDSDNLMTARTLTDWRQLLGGKFDQLSLTEDPMFMDAGNGDYRFRYDSPAHKLGIQDLDLQNIGVKPSFRYADPNEEISRLYVKNAADSVNRATIRLRSGEEAQLDLLGRTATGFALELDDAVVSYASDRPEVAVASDGKVTAIGAGKARITVSVSKNGKTSTADLYVLVDDELAGIELLPSGESIAIQTGRTIALSPIGRTEQGMFVAPDTATYASSEPDVASVTSSGEVTGHAEGQAVITATVEWEGISLTATKTVNVFDHVLDRLTGTLNDSLLQPGDTATLTVAGTLTNGEAADLTPSLAFRSMNPEVAAVDASGVVSGIGEGRTAIEASATVNGVTKTTKVDVFVYPAENTLPEGWAVSNYTRTGPPTDGLAAYDPQSGVFRIGSNGNDIWDTNDDITFVHLKEVSGTIVSLEATVQSLVNTSGDAAVSLMFRETDDSGSRNIDWRVKSGGMGLMVYRDGPSSWFANSFPNIGFPAILKLERAGSTITGYYFKNGEWIAGPSYEMEMTDKLMVGFAVQAGGKNLLPNRLATEAILSDVRITTAEDDTPPTVPAGLKALSVADTAVRLEWTASTDDSGVSRYDVYRDGVKAGTSAANQFSDSGLQPDTTYEYFIKAVDSAGNVSESSQVVRVKTLDALPSLDLEAENYDAMSGIDNYGWVIGGLDQDEYVVFQDVDLGSGAAKLDIRIGLPHEQAGQRVEVRADGVNGELLGSLTTTGTGDWTQFEIQSAALSGGAGTHDLYFVFKGGYGVGLIDWFKLFYIPGHVPDTTAPVSQATLLPGEPGGSNGWYTTPVEVTLSAQDDTSGVKLIEYRMNGGNWTTYTGSVPTIGEGVHVLEYRSVDVEGNVETAKQLKLRIDLTAPTLQVVPDASELWPANRRMVPVQISLTPSDGVSGIASVRLIGITCNEPIIAGQDVQGAVTGTEDTEFLLKAERSGTGSGRVYTITYEVTDAAGHKATAEAIVTVPHDRGKK